MRECRTIWAAIVLAVAASTLSAQAPRPTDVTETSPDVVRRGSLLYRARCSGCHGLDARGISGPDLTVTIGAGLTAERFTRIVRNGQGTEMPRFSIEQTTDTQVLEMLAYLRTLSAGGRSEPVTGNAANGVQIFQRRCASCHKVNGRGGSFGPDLSRIGAVRSPSALAGKVRDPSRIMVRGFLPVTLELEDGGRVRGLVKNEDAFSIQVMLLDGRLRGFVKARIREIVREPRSVMPNLGPDALTDAELNDLVAYLSTLRGAGSSSAQ